MPRQPLDGVDAYFLTNRTGYCPPNVQNVREKCPLAQAIADPRLSDDVLRA
jgi:hypothetical protein